MEITFQCLHCAADERFQDNLSEKLYKLGKKYDWIEDATVYLKTENNQHNREKIVELLLHVTGPDVYAKAQEESFELAAKKALEGIRRQLRKHKGKDFSPV